MVHTMPIITEILSVLADRAPRPISIEALARQVYGVLEQDHSLPSLRVSISHARKKIEPIGLVIKNYRAHKAESGGYSLITK